MNRISPGRFAYCCVLAVALMGLCACSEKTPPPAPKQAPAPAQAPVTAAPAPCTDGDADGVCDPVDACANSKPGTRVGPAGCDCDYTLQTNFAFDSAELTDTDKAELDKLAEVMLNPALNFVAGEIDGHTDNTGDAAYNTDLSTKRANAVADYLKSKGVQFGDRFVARGFGGDKPIADNSTEEGRVSNRRVTITRTDCGPGS